MSRAQFRGLVGLWAALIVARLLAPTGSLPAGVKAGVDSQAHAFAGTVFGQTTALLVLAAALVGAVGMFLGLRYTPWVFLAASVLSLIITPLVGWYAATAWQVMFEDLAYVLAGALFMAAVAGPARSLFEHGEQQPA